VLSETFASEKRRLHGGRDQRLQVTAADDRIGVFARNDLALLGQPELTVHASGWLCEHRVVARPPAASHRASPAGEQPDTDPVLLEHLYERNFRLVELPVRREEPAVLIAVRIPEHHLLEVPSRREKLSVKRIREEPIHDAIAFTEIFDRFEQRDDVDRK